MNIGVTAPGAKNTASPDRREADSMLVAVNDRDQLHVRHFRDGTRNTSVVLLHGLFDDGSLFFRDSDALAPTLARAGFDVWVPDLRGKGRSFPALTPERAAEADYGFHAAITEDLTTLFGLLREAAPDKPVYLVGHGVGGLLWLSLLARWPVCSTALASSRWFLRAVARPSSWLGARQSFGFVFCSGCRQRGTAVLP